MKMIIVLFTFLASTAWANSSLMGSWKSIDPLFADPSMQVFADLNFKPNSIIVTSRCIFKNGKTLTASLETKATYTNKAIRMLEDLDNINTDDAGNSCPVFSRKTDIGYQLTADGTLILTYEEGGYVVKFRRK